MLFSGARRNTEDCDHHEFLGTVGTDYELGESPHAMEKMACSLTVLRVAMKHSS